MSELKCPFCQQELNQDDPQIIECRNDDCKKSYFMYGSKELWQELIKLMEEKDLSDKIGKLEKKLERTRKALDVAKDAIDVISLKYHKDTPSIFLIKYAENAKAEITALEQKDVK